MAVADCGTLLNPRLVVDIRLRETTNIPY